MASTGNATTARYCTEYNVRRAVMTST